MRFDFKILSLILITLLFSGCAAIKAVPNPPRSKSEAQADPEYLVNPEALTAYASETDDNKKKAMRNEIIDERLLEIDHQFNEYEMDLWQQGIGLGIGTDWVQLVISGLTSTVGGAATKAALGAVQTGIIGAKASYDKQALMDKALPALMAQMVAERESVRAEIIRNMQSSTAQYSIYAAMGDIRRFIWAGTVPGSLQSIARDAGVKAAKADEKIKEIKIKFYKDEAGDLLWAYWMPNGEDINKDNEGKLKAWMKKNGLPATSSDIPLFLRNQDEKMIGLRVIAVQELLSNTTREN